MLAIGLLAGSKHRENYISVVENPKNSTECLLKSVDVESCGSSSNPAYTVRAFGTKDTDGNCTGKTFSLIERRWE